MVRPNHYCVVSQTKKGKAIIELEGITWFAEEDVAHDFRKRNILENDDYLNVNTFVCNEDDLSFHFDCNSDYIKHKLTQTRFIKA